VSPDITPSVDVQIACSNNDVPPPPEIEAWVVRALLASGRQFAGRAELSVRVVDTGEIQDLNREYRQQDKPTNVLSFPGGPVAGLPAEETTVLGDIVVCADIVGREAAEQGKPVADHWAHMLVHGTLHLLGYDHGDSAEAAEMEGVETRVLRQYGLPDPYGEPRQIADTI